MKNIKGFVYFHLIALLLLIYGFSPYLFGPGLTQPEPIAKYINGIFENVNASSEPYRLAFENLTFDSPLNFSIVPNQSKLIVGQRDGKIYWFDDDETTVQKNLMLDLSNEVGVIWDGGFLGMVVHPEFGTNGKNYMYTFYNTKDADGNNSPDFATSFICGLERFYGNYLQLVRFEVNPLTMEYVPDSKLTMIKMRLYNSSHRGGGLSFGNDGFLYLTTGDQGAYFNSQNITTNLDGGVLRIDVDKDPDKSHPPIRTLSSSGAGETDEFSGIEYWIPNDNPFLDSNGGIFEEYYSLGHRNPHRMTLDNQTGLMYIGEIGQTKHEEINVLSKGKNYGWPVFEGLGPGPVPDCVPSLLNNMPHEEPLVEFPRAEANSIIGGYVYRGSEVPELYGKYICGDFGNANEIWAVDTESGLYEVLGNFTPSEIISFGQDSNGELYLLKRGENVNLYKLQSKVAYDNIPQKLSETGAFTDLESLSVSEGVIPFELIDPFWSDGAIKKRWMAIPNDGSHNTPEEQISFSENGVWEFPAGSVLIKHFDYPIDDRDPNITKKIETRFSVKGDDDRFYFFTYRWNEAQDEAFLQETGLDRSIEINNIDGGTREVTWHYPSSSECIACHNNATKGTLGARTRYLNKEYDYSEKGGAIGNQLVTLSALGILDSQINDIDTPNFLTHTSIYDNNATIDDKARSYLDLNCAYCHQSGTGNRADFDLRLINSLSQTGLLTSGINSSIGIEGEGIVVPGEALKSQLYHRPASTDVSIMMPPLAKNQVDTEGLLLIEQWINQLQVPVPAPELGTYSIANKGNNKALQVENEGTLNGDNINTADFLALDSQYFVIENSFSGYFKLKANHSNKYLDVASASTSDGANIWQYEGNGTDAQLWEILGAGDGNFNIVSKLSKYYLGVQPDGNVVVATDDGSDSFKWEFSPKSPDNNLTLSAIADRSDMVGDEVDFAVTASGGDTSMALAYSLEGAPSGISIDGTTGRITGTLPEGSALGGPFGSGEYSVTVTASRSASSTVSSSFTWLVSEASTVVYRINSAGPLVASTDGGPDWSSDMVSGAQTYPGHSVSSGSLSSSSSMSYTDRDASVPGYIDQASYESLFSSERWDNSGGAEMEYSIPLPSGDYVVNVYLGNSYSGTDGVGDRSFDILIEGAPAHVGVDPVALFGHLGGGMLAYPVTVTDGSLDIRFSHGVENPLVNAIEVLGGSPAPTELTLSAIADRSDMVGDEVDFAVTASGGDTSIALAYSLEGAPSGISIDGTTGRITGTLPEGSELGGPFGSGEYSVTVTASRSASSTVSSSFTWSVSEASTVVYRINSAGPLVASTDGGPDWSSDMVSGAQTYTGHSVSSGSLSSSSSMSYTDRDASVPGYIDQASYESLFSSERWDNSGGAEMEYSIPLPSGDYVVNVYLGNSYSGTDGVGDRSFDILIEGAPAHVGVDPVALFGHLGGGMLAYPVTVTDGSLDIRFSHGVENPLVNAIEVLGGSPAPTELTLSAIADRSDMVGDEVDFAVTASGGDTSMALAYSLEGAPSGISIDGTTGRITGTLPEGSALGGPFGSGEYSVTVTASRSASSTVSSSFTWLVSEASTVVYRINSAGPLVASTDGGPDWSSDMVSGAQTYPGHSVSSGSLSSSSSMSYTDRDASVPGYIDQASYESLFSSERWDNSGGAEMEYSIPLPSGDYVVNVYLGNSYSGTDGVGDRSFDILIEGAPAHVGVDPVALFGHLGGGMLAYPVTVTDGSLDIRFSHGVENPLVNAIEVLFGGTSTNSIALKSNINLVDIAATELDEVIISPNPVVKYEKINVQLKAVSESVARISIFSMNGSEVLNRSFIVFTGRNEMSIPTSNLEAGIYLVKVSTSNRTIFNKIIIKN